MKTLHPVITIADQLPVYNKTTAEIQEEARRPLGREPEPVRCAQCFYPITQCEWVSCPQEWLQATGATCLRCGSLQKKESTDTHNIYWTEGSSLPKVLKFQHLLFSALQVLRNNYSKKPKLILGPAGSGRTALLHAVIADIISNRPEPWCDELILFFGNPHNDYVKEFGLSFEASGLTRHEPFLGYKEVLTTCTKHMVSNLTVVIDAEHIILKPEDLSSNMAWEAPLKALMTGYHNVNLILALKTSDSFTQDTSPFYMGLDGVVDQFTLLTKTLDPQPLIIFL